MLRLPMLKSGYDPKYDEYCYNCSGYCNGECYAKVGPDIFWAGNTIPPKT